MTLRITNLRMDLDEPESALPEHLAVALGTKPERLGNWRILRKSLDARGKERLRFVYTLEVKAGDEEARFLAHSRERRFSVIKVEQHEEPAFVVPPAGLASLRHPPVIIGSGPAGLVAGYMLAEQGYQPIILERGKKVSDRIDDVRVFDRGGPFEPESNYLFGEGGAGTFSDGKLTCRTSGPETRRVLELFAECKGKPSILYDYRPHLGSNRLPAVVKALRRKIEAMGGAIRFSCRAEDLLFDATGIKGIATSSGFIPAEVVMVAIGHSARDTMHMLVRRGMPIVPKPFQMGVRIEQPQETVNRVKYGSAALESQLGAADYNVVARGNHDLFSFCMCAGGYIIPSVSQEGFFCTNGMSLSKRESPYANSGLVVTIPIETFPGTDVLAGVRLQEIYERRAFDLGRGEYACPIQGAYDFLAGRITKRLPPSSYPRGLVAAEMRSLVPEIVRESLEHGLPILDRKWRGRFLRDASLVGPEARGSSPIRMPRDPESRESPGIAGLYPVGEGAGYAGGIVSAAVDGLKSAVSIVRKYAPLRK